MKKAAMAVLNGKVTTTMTVLTQLMRYIKLLVVTLQLMMVLFKKLKAID